jgi:hypothetical protein
MTENPVNTPPRRRLSRRAFLLAGLLSTPAACYADAKFFEPTWLRTKHLKIGSGNRSHRFVQLTDIHHKGDNGYFETIVSKVNALSPDAVLFTGDLIEEAEFLNEALGHISKIKSPVYGVPGNHDYWSKSPFRTIAEAFKVTGGKWLLDESSTTKDGKACIHGATCLRQNRRIFDVRAGLKNILLMHYPAHVEHLEDARFDLILAGHSHGGQVRIPFYGAPFLPQRVGRYDLGLFHTPKGPLYVSPGLGWFPVPVRFNCRPEITVIEI